MIELEKVFAADNCTVKTRYGTYPKEIYQGCVCHKDLNTQNLKALRYVYGN